MAATPPTDDPIVETQPEAVDEATPREPVDLPVVKDRAFIRLAPDEAIPIGRPFDLELALMLHGPDTHSQRTVLDEEGGIEQLVEMHLVPAFTELARIRLSYPSALNMAMQVIQQALSNKHVNTRSVLIGIQTLLRRHAEEHGHTLPEAGDTNITAAEED